MPRDVQDKKISVFGLSINECLTKMVSTTQ